MMYVFTFFFLLPCVNNNTTYSIVTQVPIMCCVCIQQKYYCKLIPHAFRSVRCGASVWPLIATMTAFFVCQLRSTTTPTHSHVVVYVFPSTVMIIINKIKIYYFENIPWTCSSVKLQLAYSNVLVFGKCKQYHSAEYQW